MRKKKNEINAKLIKPKLIFQPLKGFYKKKGDPEDMLQREHYQSRATKM